MDEKIKRLLSIPTEGGSSTSSGSERDAGSVLQSIAEHAHDVTSRALHDYSGFRNDIVLTLRPHISSVNYIEEKLFSKKTPEKVRSHIRQHADRFHEAKGDIAKLYQTYIETSSDATLDKEALRLKRRYFQEGSGTREKNFIKLKRFYEKVKSFNELAKKSWHKITRIIDMLNFLSETRDIAAHIEEEHLANISLLLRKTESFLEALKVYMKTEEEHEDHVTGSFRIVLTYDPSLRYSLAGFFGEAVQEDEEIVSDESEEEEGSREGVRGEKASSIAHSIIIESREHRLNRASIFSATILGSRDWNRTPQYSMEVAVAYYEESLVNVKKAYRINLDPDDVKGPLSGTGASSREGAGKELISEYLDMERSLLEQLASELTESDFPGLEKPRVFLYHCGPHVFYNLLTSYFHRAKIGDIVYLDEARKSIQEIPEEFVKKNLIDWWNDYMSPLDGEDVDSYLTYSRAAEMVKKEYRALYEEGVRKRRKEQPGASYFGLDEWMRKNRTRVFGLRKFEVFKRFLGETVAR